MRGIVIHFSTVVIIIIIIIYKKNKKGGGSFVIVNFKKISKNYCNIIPFYGNI